MKTTHTATVINGELKLDDPLELPEQSRVTVSVTPIKPSMARQLEALRQFKAISDATPLFGEGRRLTRDELHERG